MSVICANDLIIRTSPARHWKCSLFFWNIVHQAQYGNLKRISVRPSRRHVNEASYSMSMRNSVHGIEARELKIGSSPIRIQTEPGPYCFRHHFFNFQETNKTHKAPRVITQSLKFDDMKQPRSQLKPFSEIPGNDHEAKTTDSEYWCHRFSYGWVASAFLAFRDHSLAQCPRLFHILFLFFLVTDAAICSPAFCWKNKMRW